MRTLDEDRRDALCQIRAAKIRIPPAIMATKAQLGPALDVGVIGNAGFCVVVSGGGKLATVNWLLVIL